MQYTFWPDSGHLRYTHTAVFPFFQKFLRFLQTSISSKLLPQGYLFLHRKMRYAPDLLPNIPATENIHRREKRINHGGSGKHCLTVDFRNDLVQNALCSRCFGNFHVIAVIFKCSLIVAQESTVWNRSSHRHLDVLSEAGKKSSSVIGVYVPYILLFLNCFSVRTFFPLPFHCPMDSFQLWRHTHTPSDVLERSSSKKPYTLFVHGKKSLSGIQIILSSQSTQRMCYGSVILPTKLCCNSCIIS